MTGRHHIELIFDRECPNASKARDLLRSALAASGLPADWREWDRGAVETPRELRGLGSPTILVGGADVVGDDLFPSGANRCRVYPDEAGRLHGVPPLAAVVAALSRKQVDT
jgi:hypothetical protein